ncbi:MAG: hypothetical protein ACFE0P_15485 [Oceanicaulis sp.]
MSRIASAFAWLCVIGAITDAAALAHLAMSGIGFMIPLGRYLTSGPDVLAGVAAVLDAILPGPLWRAVQDLPAGAFFAARLLTLFALAMAAFALARASRSRSADS